MKYVGQITALAQFIIKGIFPVKGDFAMDLTLGRGKDTSFLSKHFKNVVAMDIQEKAVNDFKDFLSNSSYEFSNVEVYQYDHSELASFIKEKNISKNPDLIIYNLGYLPGSDKSVTTNPDTTVESLKQALVILKNAGFIVISIYVGHDGGKERDRVLEFLQELPDEKYSVLRHSYFNRGNNPPELVVIEKR